MIQYDYHLHSSFSSDSETDPVLQIEEAINRGLKGICFTDHLDYDYPSIEEFGMNFLFNIDEYINKLNELKERYASKISIRTGVETGLRNEKEVSAKIRDMYHKLVTDYAFDFVIGSTHCLEMIDPLSVNYWRNRTSIEGMEKYFEAVYDNICEYNDFDTCGHLDYLVRYVPKGNDWKGPESYHPSDYSDIIDRILRKLIEKGKALECNSAGLKYGIGFAHPEKEILQRYRALGGELITIGSDGHKPEHIAYDFDKVENMLTDAGFKYYTVFEGRKPMMVKL